MGVIAIANQKGGVAKTTTATSLAGGLAARGRRVLLIDMDPQCNSSDTYRASIESTATLYDVLCEGVDAADAVQHTGHGDIIPGDPLLGGAEGKLNKTGKEHTLRKAGAGVRGMYDHIILDTPPALGVLLINALTFADSVVVPVTTDRYGLQGLSQLDETIRAAVEYTNPSLAVAGLLMVRHNARTNLAREIAGMLPSIAEGMGTILFDTAIRESVAAREAQASRASLLEYAPDCTTALDYMAFADEIIRRGI
jgi:chromosome partitioning protein